MPFLFCIYNADWNYWLRIYSWWTEIFLGDVVSLFISTSHFLSLDFTFFILIEEHVRLEMQLIHIRVHILVGCSSTLFQFFLELELRHNCFHDVWLFILHSFCKKHGYILMDNFVIFQLRHRDGIRGAFNVGYIVLSHLKLNSCRLAHSWNLIWTFQFDVFLHYFGCCDFRHRC